MKDKSKYTLDEEMHDQYSFKGGMRGKYATRHASGIVAAIRSSTRDVGAKFGDVLSEALGRADSLPPGLPLRVGVGDMGGPAWCILRPGIGALAHATMPGCEAEIAETLNLQFEGLDGTHSSEIEIRRPDGLTVLVPLQPDDHGEYSWDWTPMPGDPLGSYIFTVTQDSIRAQGRIEVHAPATPRVSVVPRRAVSGASFTIIMAGFEPRSVVPLRVHRQVGIRRVPDDTAKEFLGYLNAYEFVALLAPAIVDDRGEAMYELQTSRNDRGTYAIETDPPAQKGPAFFDRVFRVGSDPDEEKSFARYDK